MAIVLKKAFTLIELLVVIAIIAILAAILFPVFAQAKDAAKDTANLSNLKQVALGNLMYCSDSDDLFALSTQIDNTGNFLTWQEVVMPYMKSQDIILDVKLPHPPSPSVDADGSFYQRNSHFGMPLRGVASTLYTPPSSGNSGSWYFGASLRTSKITNGQQWLIDGILGAGVNPAFANAFYDYQTAPSLSQTSIDQPANMYMVGQSANWDMWWGVVGVPMLYTVYWIDNPPHQYSIYPQTYGWSGPHARKRPRNSLSSGFVPAAAWPPAASAPVDADGVPNGFCIYATADGSAHATDVRGVVYKGVLRSDGSYVCNQLWPGSR